MAAQAGSPFRPAPIQSSKFRYRPSRNPYAQKVKEFPGRIFSDHLGEEMPGNWKEHFREQMGITPKEIRLEIGCNGGHVLNEWAKANPETAYIGLDWKFKQIYRAQSKAQKHGIENTAYLRAHALRLPYLFAPNELDRVYLFFPDPWPKKSQMNNRLVQEKWLREIHPLFDSRGVLEIRTDHDGYFEWMLEEIGKAQDLWRVDFKTIDRHVGVSEPDKLEIPDVTLFEKVWIKDGIKIKELHLTAR